MRYHSAMSTEQLKVLLSERCRLMREVATLSRLLHGSWVERYSVCSQPGCKCRRGERHGPRRYLVVNEDGRQRQKYVPNDCVEAVMEGLAQDRRLREIVARLTLLNLAIVKEERHEAP
jgi:hypothetical protein